MDFKIRERVAFRVRKAGRLLVQPAEKLLRAGGYEVIKIQPPYPPDFEKTDIEDVEAVKPYTLTSPERIISLVQSVNYIVNHEIPGDFVECGVWKGGSMMAIARCLLRMGATDRHLYLFDTFEGMSTPTPVDVGFDGEVAAHTWGTPQERKPNAHDFTYAELESVKKAVLGTGYPADKIHFIKGKVEDTLPEKAPSQIALLRLDTDWYESTLHELTHLYPKLSKFGVLIVDDYGHWAGARKATDEYLKTIKKPLFLHRIDYTGRIAIKP